MVTRYRVVIHASFFEEYANSFLTDFEMRAGRKGTLGVRLGSCMPGQVGQEVYLSGIGNDLLRKGSCYLGYMACFGFFYAVHDGNIQVLKSFIT